MTLLEAGQVALRTNLADEGMVKWKEGSRCAPLLFERRNLVAELHVHEDGVGVIRNGIGDAGWKLRRQRGAKRRNLSRCYRELAVGIRQILIVERKCHVLVVFVADSTHRAVEVQRIRAADFGIGLEVVVHTKEGPF